MDQKELIVRQTADYRNLTELGQESDKNFAIVYLRRSQFSEFINRRFMKFDELLSFIGGFKQILFTFFGFFVISYNRKSMEIDIINKLYNFERQPDEKAAIQKMRDSSEEVSIIKNGNEFEHQDAILQQKKNIESFLMDFRNLYKDTKIKKQFQLFFHQLSCNKFCSHPQQELIDKGREQISKDFDIQEIIYLLQQVNTLKRVLFNEDQLIFFNLIPKPTLHKQKMAEIPSRLILQTNEEEFYQKWKLLREMYNSQLLNLLEEDTQRILEAINIRENQQVHYPTFQPQ